MIDYSLDAGCDDTTSTSYSDCEVWAHQSAQGSVIATSDDNGDVIDPYTYGTYGEPGESGGIPSSS